MKLRTLVLGGLAACVAVRAAQMVGRHADSGKQNRWLVVTINRSPETVASGRLPEPLEQLRDRIETQIRTAPGDRGTELAARPHDGTTDDRREVRRALRESKMLLETGEVLSPDKPPTTRRTLKNLPLEIATRRAREVGRL